MKIKLFENKYKPGSATKIFIADIVCFLLVVFISFGVSYAYFSSRADVSGSFTMANIKIEYRDDENTSVTSIQAIKNDDANSLADLTNIPAEPGDKITIKGKVFNSSEVDVFVLAKLEIINKDSSNNVIDTEVVWFNIKETKALYVQRGLFQVGASDLAANKSQDISIPYTLEGDRYTNDYKNIEIKLIITSYQKNFLSSAEDYNDYAAVGDYSKDSIYATHQMTGRLRDKWSEGDANISGLTINNLEKDASGDYLIKTCKDWMIVKANSTQANTKGKTFKLKAYLDFEGYQALKTIEYFWGTLDGCGYTICNWTDIKGLINNAYGNISNLGIDGFTITSSEKKMGAISMQFSAIMENCFAIGNSQYDNSINSDIHEELDDSFAVGGLIGGLSGNTANGITAILRNSFAVVKITATGNHARAWIGGLVGEDYPKDTIIQNCYYAGSLSINHQTTSIGLISGYGKSGNLQNCFALTSSATHNSSNIQTIAPNTENIINCAYKNSSSANIVKQGSNQTSIGLNEELFKSSGLMRDAFSWNTAIWGTNIYNNENNNLLPILRAFYNL